MLYQPLIPRALTHLVKLFVDPGAIRVIDRAVPNDDQLGRPFDIAVIPALASLFDLLPELEISRQQVVQTFAWVKSSYLLPNATYTLSARVLFAALRSTYLKEISSIPVELDTGLLHRQRIVHLLDLLHRLFPERLVQPIQRVRAGWHVHDW